MTRVRRLKMQVEQGTRPGPTHRRSITITAVACIVALVLAASFLLPDNSVSADDFNFGTENATKGTSTNPTERNTENAAYNVLAEADQYTDTNHSGSSENVVTGTTGGGTFPTALDTDDSTRRNYIEASAGGGDYIAYMRAASDTQAQFVPYPASPTTHYDKIDEPQVNGDTSDYIYPDSATDVDILTVADISTPAGSPAYDIQMWAICAKYGGTQSANIQGGIRIGSTNYQAFSVNPARDTTAYTNYSGGWTTDPSDSNEWTLTDLNGLSIYFATSDISPVPRVYQAGITVFVNYSLSYTLDAQITYSSVASTSQTTGFQVLCNGYRNGDTESVNLQAWNYTSSAWVTKATISAGSDTDYNFNLLGWAANCERSSGNVVLLRLSDVGGDATQTTIYVDMLKVNRIEQGYALDVDMTCTVAPQYGNVTLRVKGYTSGEQFNVNVWNYSSSAYDINKLSITSLSNTWQTTVDLVDASHRSGTSIKIQFTDNTLASSDTTADSLYLDVVWITRYFTDPTITSYGATPPTVTESEAVVFFLTYTDFDNQAPSANYPKVHIDSTDYTMTANDSDSVYADGKLYYYSKSDLSGGSHNYWFIVDDANSNDVTTGTAQVNVNRKPTLSGDSVLPTTGNAGETFSFKVTFTDQDGDMPSYIKSVIDAAEYSMTEDDAGDTDTTNGKAYHYDKALSGGNHPYYFKTSDVYSGNVQSTEKNVYVNNLPALSGYGVTPAPPRYVTSQFNFTVTFTDSDNDLPSSIKWREGSGVVQNISMVQVDPYDLTTSDGKAYCLFAFTLGHGSHSYDYYASDGGGFVTGGSGSILIANRAPAFTNEFADDHEWRNTYWEYDYAYSELDGDSVGFQMSTNASFLSINPTSGLVYGTTSDPVGWYQSYVWCNDSYTGFDMTSFILYVDNREPVITNGPGTHIDQWRNQAWYYDFDFSDADGDSMAWERSGEGWLTIAANGNLSGTTSDAPGLYTFTIYANDSHGGTDNYVFDIHIEDRAPDITNGPGIHVDEWRNTFWQYDFDYSDADSDSITWGRSGVTWLTIGATGILSGDTTDVPGEYAITVYANDSYSGQDTYVFTLHVVNRIPQVTSAGNTTQQDGTYMAYHVTATDGDSDSLSIEFWSEAGWLSLSDWWVNGTATGVGVYQCKLWVNDTYDSDLEEWQVEVTSAGNQPPSFTTSPTLLGAHPWDYYYDANANDPELDILTFGLEGNCTAYLGIVPSTGVVSGNILLPGWWYMNVSVTDGTSIVWQNVTLTSTNVAPTFDSSPIESWQHGTEYSYDANAHDDNGDSYSFGLAGNSTSFLTVIPGTGMVTGTPPTVGWWYVNVSVSDAWSTTWQSYVLTGLNTAPSFTSSGITEWQNGTEYVYDANGNDANSDVLVWSLEGNGTFLQINSTTGFVNGTIPVMGWWYVNISLSDSWSTVWQNFTVYSLNTAPSITTSPGLTGAPGVEYSYDANANDLNGDNIEWAATEKPIWLVVDPVTGQCTGIPVIEGNYDVELVAWDGTTYSYQNWTIAVSIPVEPPVTPPINPPDSGGPTEANPQAKFTYTIVNNKIVLKDTTYGTVTRLQWDFGDGTGSQEPTVTHTYLQPGTYTIILTVWNGQYKSIAQVTLTIGSADEWRVEKGDSGWAVSTPKGTIQLDAILCLMAGIVLLILSFGGQKFPLPRILSSKVVKLIGLILLILGGTFYAI